jgi:hypothetical protein
MGAELGEEIADAVDDQERQNEGLDIGHKGDDGEGYRHHRKAKDLDRLAPHPVHHRCRNQISGRWG